MKYEDFYEKKKGKLPGLLRPEESRIKVIGPGPTERIGIGLGDMIEGLVKPIAIALRLPCLDKNKKLRPESGCAKRREALNKIRLRKP